MNNIDLAYTPSKPSIEPHGLKCVNRQPSIMTSPDRHNDIEVFFLQSGWITYLIGGQKVTVKMGNISLFWGAIPHQIVDSCNDSQYVVATIPLQVFLQWQLPENFVQALMQGQLLSEVSTNHLEVDIGLFERWCADLAETKHNNEQAVLLEIQARLTRMASALPAQSVTPRISNTSLTKVEQMACYVSQNYRQKVTVSQVASTVQLNPNYAMALFQKTIGTTLISYLTQHRLSHAHRLLTTSEKAITEIAFESGFQSISRFNDIFNQAFSCSPRAYRKLQRS